MATEPTLQQPLFPLPDPVRPAAPTPRLLSLAKALPPSLRLGTMSWSFPGWAGLVYAPGTSARALANHGLSAYARHPLFRAVEIDRSFYEPLSADQYRTYAAQVPDDFRFVVKAHEVCATIRFPVHPRYGAKRGQPNPLYLDAGYAAEQVVAPVFEGLGAKAGLLLFQFPPQAVGDPLRFADKLGEFLRRLPRELRYAVELRNAELLGPRYGQMLANVGALHCHNLWARMPSLAEQARVIPPSARNPLLVRWLLPFGDKYEEALDRYTPFDKLVDEDPARRQDIADLIVRAEQHGVPAMVLVNNKAEGCAPESLARLAEAIAQGRPASIPLR